jgi:hypothetical protein
MRRRLTRINPDFFVTYPGYTFAMVNDTYPSRLRSWIAK